MSHAIRIRHLWQRYGTSFAVRDLSFDVAHGEVFGFIGPNGSGKTTTIRVMTTLLEPTAGRVEIDGHDVTIDANAVRKKIGFMPDHAGVYDRVSTREYLEFFADAYEVETPSTVVQAVLELTDLKKLQDKLVTSMSKGMKQRLQLARTLLHDPKVLVMDEPASDLDPRARIEMRDLISELRRMGKTIFLSSHILTELADICTSVAILERGTLVVAGPIHEIGARLAARSQGGAQPQTPSTTSARIRTLSDAGMLAASLDARKDLVIRAEPDGNAIVVVHYQGSERALAKIVRALVEDNVDVVGIEPQRNELERVFMEATKGDIQ
jgi:ABC-2 type transport system ATP-binding protein